MKTLVIQQRPRTRQIDAARPTKQPSFTRWGKNSLQKVEKGFTQVEVLVSVLVLAIGILGMGTLQMSSLQNSTNSVLRTQAVYFSYEILDRIRANNEAAVTAIKTNSIDFGAPTNANSCIDSECSAAELLAYDLVEWKCSLGKYSTADTCKSLFDGTNALVELDAGLPEGDGSISINASNEYTITIRWLEERKNSETPTLTSFVLKGVL